jgi:hypothetical protein
LDAAAPVTDSHEPALPGSAQDWQEPSQATLQQMPSVQNPDVQSLAVSQIWPSP